MRREALGPNHNSSSEFLKAEAPQCAVGIDRPHTTSKQTDTVRWPEAHECLALYVLLRQRPEDPGVGGVGPVVAHHEDVVLRHPGLGKGAPIGKLLVRVGLLLGLAV